MKNLLLAILGCSLFLVAQPAAVQAAPFATKPAAEAAAATNTKSLTKADRKAQRIQKRAERRAKFAAWVAKVMAGESADPIVAAVIAFFLGWLGIHRVYMGGSGILILLYIITLGGIFGLIPLIDFIRLLIGHGDHYRGNSDFFAAFKS